MIKYKKQNTHEINELKKEILKNNGGTYNAKLENANLTNGFMVSIEGWEYVTHDINDAIKKMIEYKKIVENKEGFYIGAWVDVEDNNKIYIDISKRLTSQANAKHTARKNRQKAYYDIRKEESVYLNYNIAYYSLYKNILNTTGEIINQIFIKGYDTIKEIPANYRTDTKNYLILKDYINITEL